MRLTIHETKREDHRDRRFSPQGVQGYQIPKKMWFTWKNTKSFEGFHTVKQPDVLWRQQLSLKNPPCSAPSTVFCGELRLLGFSQGSNLSHPLAACAGLGASIQRASNAEVEMHRAT